MRGGQGGAKYLGPVLVRGPEILINIWSLCYCQEGWGPVMRDHLLVLGPDHGSRRPCEQLKLRIITVQMYKFDENINPSFQVLNKNRQTLFVQVLYLSRCS